MLHIIVIPVKAGILNLLKSREFGLRGNDGGKMRICNIACYFSAFFLTLFFAGCAGDKPLLKEMEEYSPPRLYHATGTAPGNSSTVPEKKAADNAFAVQKEKLEEMRKQWEKIRTEPQPEEVFYSPDPEKVKSLANAFAEEKAAEAVLRDRFTPETLEILVWGRNPAVAAAEKNFRASLETYSQASNLEDILRQYSAFNAGLMTGVGNMGAMESVDKKFPFPGILALRGNIVSLDVRIAAEDIEIARRTAITQIRRVYWDLLYNQRAEETVRQMDMLLKGLERAVVKRYEAGKSALQELTGIQIQKEKIAQELITVQEERRNLETGLRAVLNLSSGVKIGIPADKVPAASFPAQEKLISLAIQRRQELKKLRAMISRMELMIEMAETEIRPGFTLNLSLSENQAVNQAGTMKMEEPFAVSTKAGMGEGLPKAPWTGLADAYLRETKQRLDSLRRELGGAEADTHAKVREAWFAADRAKREAALYRERVVRLSGLSFSTALKAYETGIMPYAEIIDSLMTLLENRLAAERKNADAGQAMAVLEETVGGLWQ